MELDKCIFSRRSCRDYLKKKIPLEKIGQMLESARHAPSSGNLQNWDFTIVRDTEKRKKISEICNQEWMFTAPVHIVICNKKSDILNQYPDRGNLYSTQNCAIASAHIMLKAADLGLGSCFVGAFNEQEIKEFLGISKDISPEAIITLGYIEKVDEDSERIELKEITFFESYGNKELKDEIFPIVETIKKLKPYKPSYLVKKAKQFVKKFKKENKK